MTDEKEHEMELSYTAEQNRFREEVRSWIAEAMPPEMKKRAEDGRELRAFRERWRGTRSSTRRAGSRRTGRRRSAARAGTSRSAPSSRRSACARMRPGSRPSASSMVGPLLIQYGNGRAEAALPAEDPLGRGGLVPGLLRAERRLRPRDRCSCAPTRTATTTS